MKYILRLIAFPFLILICLVLIIGWVFDHSRWPKCLDEHLEWWIDLADSILPQNHEN